MKTQLRFFSLILCILTLTSFLAQAQVPSYVPTNGLVGWWPFNGNANDESGNGNNGTVNGATLTTDRFGNTGKAYDFNGINNWIQVPNSTSLQLGDTMSFSVWVNVNSWFGSGNYFPILCKSNNSSIQGSYELTLQDVLISGHGVNHWGGNQLMSNFPTSQWKLITYILTDSIIRIYIDGNLLSNSTQQMHTATVVLFDPLIFGKNIPGPVEYANGQMDDIGIWNRALTQQEITALYNAQPCTPQIVYIHDTLYQAPPCLPNYVPTNGLVGWWPFCGNAHDESGNGNNGTVNGATLTTDRFGNAGKAYNFDGVDDYIQCLQSGPGSNTNISLCFWMKTSMQVNNGPSGGVGHIFGYGADNVNKAGQSFQVMVNGGAAAGSCSQSLTFDSYGAAIAKSDMFLNNWDFYCIVNDTFLGNNVINQLIYKNGSLMTQNCFLSPGVPPNPTNFSTLTPIRIGKFYGTSCLTCQVNNPLYFNGSLDDIGIWNRALTQQEITALYTGNPCSPQIVNIHDTVYQAPPCLPNYIPTTGLVGWWPFCGNAHDESGNGNNGTVNGATLTTDRFGNAGKAFSFDGVSNEILVPHKNSLNLLPISISIWFKTSNSQQNKMLVSKYGCQTYSGYSFNLNNNKPSAYYYSNGSQNNSLNLDGISNNSQSLNDNQWHHGLLIIKADSTNIFIDNNYVINEPTTTGQLTLTNSLEDLHFAKYAYGSCSGLGQNYFYDGILDDIGIWNRALTQQEITALYTGSACTQMVNIYDTIPVYDTLTTHISINDTTHFNVFDTLTTHITFNDTITTHISVTDTTHMNVYDTLTTHITFNDTIITHLFDTLTTHITINDTMHINIYDTIINYVAVTDTLIINANLTGVNPPNSNTIKVYPNPANDHLYINYGNYASMNNYTIRITNILSQTVYSSLITQQQVLLDLSKWTGKGTYILRIFNPAGTIIETRTIILQ